MTDLGSWEPQKQIVEAKDSKKIRLIDVLGESMEDSFEDFDLGEVQEVLSNLASTNTIDLAHAEYLQQQTLRCADLLSEYIGKLTKTIHYLESKVSAAENKASLNYEAPDGKKTSLELKKWAGKCDADAGELNLKLAKAKGAKALLDKKYDIITKAHFNYKEIAIGIRRSIPMNSVG